MRSGTLAVPLIVGMGAASEIAKNRMDKDYIYIKMLFNSLLKKLKNNLSDIVINSSIK